MDDSLVRKGMWTKEEDLLLKQCIELHGEGKWHKVPQRAGLNRCRKSCRLRWLNYLSPEIKRGCFAEDEVDLIIRLHKLLGNKWSLIAGRLPRRTGNDVKNFWNTHMVMEKKLSTSSYQKGTTCGIVDKRKIIAESNIVKPQPRTLSISQVNCTMEITKPVEDSNYITLVDETHYYKQQSNAESSLKEVDECFSWWYKLLDISMENEGMMNDTLPMNHQLTGETPLFGSNAIESDDCIFSNVDTWEPL